MAWIANWIPSMRVRQKETVTVYCFTCVCICDDCLIQRRKSNYQRQLFRVTLHMGCNYSVKEHWLRSDRQWLRDLITGELTAKITSRKKVSGKKAFTLACIFVNPQKWIWVSAHVPQTPWLEPGAWDWLEALYTHISPSFGSAEKCGATCLSHSKSKAAWGLTSSGPCTEIAS